jgi:hypothetical protein
MNTDSAFGIPLRLESRPGASLQKARIDGEALAKAFAHWRGLDPAKRPLLRSLSHSAGEDKNPVLNAVFDLGGKEGWICLELMDNGKAFPDFSAIWPYGRWWQEELTLFSGLRFEGTAGIEGVSWRLA